MRKFKSVNRKKTVEMECENGFEAESIETKVRRVTETNEPVEAISPIIFTERKDGVRPEYNIRTDKWDIAQQAMNTIALGKRQKRHERLNAEMDKPASSSEMNVQTDTSK